jgi:putative transposase
VSTLRVDKLVETLGITSPSKSQVSVMAKELDTAVEAFRTRPLEAGPYTFVAADALVLKVRDAGRVVNVHALRPPDGGMGVLSGRYGGIGR